MSTENDLMLRVFKEYNRLDQVVQDAKTIPQKMILLCDWVHHQIPLWRYGGNEEQTQNPIYNLLAIRSGVLRGWCGNYSILLIAALQSMGIEARHVSLSKKPELGTDQHNVVEGWRPIKCKWMALDPLYNVHFVRNNNFYEYLSAEEISKFVNLGTTDRVTLIHPVFNNHIEPAFQTNLINYFYKYEYFNVEGKKIEKIRYYDLMVRPEDTSK